MTNRLRFCGFQFALIGAGLAVMTAAHAVELDPKAVAVQTPDQFKWRDPANQAATNQAVLLGDPTKAGLHIVINKFKPNRLGTPHYHTHDRYIMVVDGAPWRGTGPVVDWSHATRVPKGTFMIDHAGKVHWDGTKEESGAYLIADVGPDSQTQISPATGPVPLQGAPSTTMM